MVELAYGVVLAKASKHADAERFYKRAASHLIDPAEAHYNLGLLYLEMKEPLLALDQARLAYEKGYPLTGLKQKLQELGLFLEPQDP